MASLINIGSINWLPGRFATTWLWCRKLADFVVVIAGRVGVYGLLVLWLAVQGPS